MEKPYRIRYSLALVAVSCLLSASGALSVRDVEGRLSIVRESRPVVTSIDFDVGEGPSVEIKKSSSRLADGTKVWNRWCEDPSALFRLEVAERTDGAVEITMAGCVSFDSPRKTRCLSLVVPGATFEGRSYRSVSASPRRYSEAEGRFDGSFKGFRSRWLAVDGLTFDFNPLGAGTYSESTGRGLVSSWNVARTGNGYRFSVAASSAGYAGGGLWSKLVLREGDFADFDRVHSLRSFVYSNPLRPRYLLAFGASRRGKAYGNGNLKHNRKRGFGWVDVSGALPESVPGGGSEGALYSAVGGTAPATYRFSGLPDGFYFLTLCMGNYHGAGNSFDVSANGRQFVASAEVPPKHVRKVTRLVRAEGGKIDVAFSGNWLLSVAALQAVLYDSEDFSIAGRPWRSDGFEPWIMSRNGDYAPGFAPGVRDETFALHEPGTCFAGTPREIPAPVERLDASSPLLAWIRDVRIYRAFGNYSSMSELDAPGTLQKWMDRELGFRNVNAVLLSGMLSRHTFMGHEERGLAAVKRFTAEAHRRGLKVLDHIDATLLWNANAGFRVMAERLPELVSQIGNGLPSCHFCINNPGFREKFFAYLERDVVEAGIDGLQIDEVKFWRHGCVCRHCRAAFTRDTGWSIPFNELDAAWERDSRFMRVFRRWRIRACTDFLVALKRRLKSVKPDIVLSDYTTPYGLCSTYDSIGNGRDILDLPRAIDLAGVEVMTRSVMKSARAELPVRRMMQLVTRTYGTPVWNWYYNSDWQNDYVAWAIDEMCGQIPLLTEIPRPEGTPSYPAFRGMRREGADTVAEVALLFSAENRNFGGHADYCKELSGTAQALDALHIPYDFIGDELLAAGRLDKYKVLFLGTATEFSAEQRRELERFAARGGVVKRGQDAVRFARHSLKVGTKCAFDPDPAKESAFREGIAQACSSARVWSVKAPSAVAASLWRERDGAFAAHFLNLTGVKNRPGETVTAYAPDPAFPPLASDIVFSVPLAGLVDAVASSPEFAGERQLKVKSSDGVTFVTLPKDLFATYVFVRVSGKQKSQR